MDLHTLPRLSLKVSDLLSLPGNPQILPLKGKNPYRSEYNQKRPSSTPRQREFENALRTISASFGSRTIPVAFEDGSGKHYVLDAGCVGHAVANAFLEFLPKGELVRAVTLREIQPETSLRKYCRICWNTAHWREPTGEARHMEVGKSYVRQNGFGHEEWLFNFAWKLRVEEQGNALFRFGYLQPIAKYREKYEGKSLDVLVYTIGPNKERIAIAEIRNAYVPTIQELNWALARLREEGWIKEMRQHLKGLRIPDRPLQGNFAPHIANIRFREEDVHFFDPPVLLPRPSKPYKIDRYQPLNWDDDFESGSEGRAGASRQRRPAKRKSEADRKRKGTDPGVVRQTHNRIQNALFAHLQKVYGKANVDYEEGWVDITVRSQGKTTLVEIKTANTAKGCVREALGQLLEYAHYPDLDRVCHLVVVGPARPDKAVEIYLAHLNRRYGLPLTYRQWIEIEGRLTGSMV